MSRGQVGQFELVKRVRKNPWLGQLKVDLLLWSGHVSIQFHCKTYYYTIRGDIKVVTSESVSNLVSKSVVHSVSLFSEL